MQRCHFVVSDWCSTAVILQLPCESARLFVSTLQSGDNFIKNTQFAIPQILGSGWWICSSPENFLFLSAFKNGYQWNAAKFFFLSGFSCNLTPRTPRQTRELHCQNASVSTNTGVSNSEIESVLTCLWRGDVDDYRSSGCGTQVRYSVLALDCEAVVGVRLQVGDEHAGW